MAEILSPHTLLSEPRHRQFHLRHDKVLPRTARSLRSFARFNWGQCGHSHCFRHYRPQVCALPMYLALPVFRFLRQMRRPCYRPLLDHPRPQQHPTGHSLQPTTQHGGQCKFLAPHCRPHVTGTFRGRGLSPRPNHLRSRGASAPRPPSTRSDS